MFDNDNWMMNIYRNGGDNDDFNVEKNTDWLEPFQLRLNETPRVQVEMDMDKWSKMLNEFYDRLEEKKEQQETTTTIHRQSMREILDKWSKQIGDLNEWYRNEHNFQFGDPLARRRTDKTLGNDSLMPDQSLVYNYLEMGETFSDLLKMISLGVENKLPFISASHMIPPQLRETIGSERSLEEMCNDMIEFDKRVNRGEELVIVGLDQNNSVYNGIPWDDRPTDYISTRSNLYKLAERRDMWILFEPKTYMMGKKWQMYPRLTIVVNNDDYPLMSVMKRTVDFFSRYQLDQDRGIGCTFIAQSIIAPSMEKKRGTRWREERDLEKVVREMTIATRDVLYDHLSRSVLDVEIRGQQSQSDVILSSRSINRLFQAYGYPIWMSSCDREEIGLTIGGRKASIPKKNNKSGGGRRSSIIETYPRSYGNITLGKKRTTNQLVTTQNLPIIPPHFSKNLSKNDDRKKMVAYTWISYNANPPNQNEMDRFSYRMQEMLRTMERSIIPTTTTANEDIIQELVENRERLRNIWTHGMTMLDPRWNGNEKNLEQLKISLSQSVDH